MGHREGAFIQNCYFLGAIEVILRVNTPDIQVLQELGLKAELHHKGKP